MPVNVVIVVVAMPVNAVIVVIMGVVGFGGRSRSSVVGSASSTGGGTDSGSATAAMPVSSSR